MTSEPELCSFVVVDVENSRSHPNLSQIALRARLYHVLHTAMSRCEMVLPQGHQEDRGDGVLLVVPQKAATVVDLFDPFLDTIIEILQEENFAVEQADWMRLRIGMHFGQVHRDDEGWSSTDLNAAFQLIDTMLVKSVLRAAPRAHCLIAISEVLHRMVVQHGYRSINPADYRHFVVPVKPENLTVWVRVPGYARPPVPDPPPNREQARQEATSSTDPDARIWVGDVHGNVFNAKVKAEKIIAGNNIEHGQKRDDE